jgi:DNA mismatch repair protein MutH
VGSPAELNALLAHARALVGVELGDLADGLGLPVPVGRVRTKGWSGQVIEQELGVATGGVRGPDFAALGVELKTVPVSIDIVPVESTAVCQIDPIAIAAESWETSYVRAKLASVLFVALEVPPGARSVGERRVAAVRLWSPNADEERTLRADFELFVRQYFRRGRAAEITGHLGEALQARPKGGTRPTPATTTTPRAAPPASVNTASTCAPPSSPACCVRPPDVATPARRSARASRHRE